MKIYYIYHSCFVVETKNSFLVFDYYKSIDNKGDFHFKSLLKEIFQSKKDLYIFASHSHGDHYNSEILSWGQSKDNSYYIFSNDIRLYQNIKNLYHLAEDQEVKIKDTTIKTFGSTDEGVSFLVNIDNLNIFHAGDLNWWKWNDDSKDEEEEMEKAFKSIIKKIILSNASFNFAFFPVDGRLEENYLCGGDYFIDIFQPEYFIPMHFADDYKVITDFIESQSTKNINTKIMKIDYPNQVLYDIF